MIHDFPQFNLFDPPRKLKSASIPHYNKDERTKNSFLRNWRTISPDQVKLVLLLSLTAYVWSELTWAFLPQPDRYQFSYKSVKKMKLYKKNIPCVPEVILNNIDACIKQEKWLVWQQTHPHNCMKVSKILLRIFLWLTKNPTRFRLRSPLLFLNIVYEFSTQPLKVISKITVRNIIFERISTACYIPTLAPHNIPLPCWWVTASTVISGQTNKYYPGFSSFPKWLLEWFFRMQSFWVMSLLMNWISFVRQFLSAIVA